MWGSGAGIPMAPTVASAAAAGSRLQTTALSPTATSTFTRATKTTTLDSVWPAVLEPELKGKSDG